MKQENQAAAALREAGDEFVSQWGVIGNAWGINRTMAQIHALLITAPAALSTDEIMEELKISRGNAHSNLRDLVSWGLVRSVVRKGECLEDVLYHHSRTPQTRTPSSACCLKGMQRAHQRFARRGRGRF